MKRLFTVLVMVVGLLCGANAGVRDSVVCIVMDSANALIPKAKVTMVCTKKTYTTGVDGRVVVPLSGTAKVKISANGYQPKVLSLTNKEAEVILRLKPSKRKSCDSDGPIRAYGVSGSSRARTYPESVRYSKDAAVATFYEAESDGMALSAAESKAVTGYGGMASNHQPGAGKLTAGEVNDFAKWTLWDGLFTGSHKEFVPKWRLYLNQRYTVQVTNAQGYPLANRFVSLTDGQGMTLFQARTDNTGKAELWNGITANGGRSEAKGLKIAVEGKTVDAKPWSEGMNRVVLDETCGASMEADVFFVVDATGSMSDELRYLQAELKDVVARSQGAVSGLKIRTGALVYRDYGDEYLTRISRLTDEIQTTQTFIDRQQANGGGDFEEAVPEALKAAMNVADWNDNARARILFIVLDAPCHDDSATIAMLHEQVRNAAAIGIRIVPVVCSGLDKAGELLMREMALATNGTSFFLTDDSGIGGTHLKPTTDTLKVEHLNDMLVRTIVEFTTMPACEQPTVDEDQDDEQGQFLPNPFSAEELKENPALPQGETTLYLIDVSGKLITILEGQVDTLTPEQIASEYGLSTGVYFLKAFYNGEWHTRKLLLYRF